MVGALGRLRRCLGEPVLDLAREGGDFRQSVRRSRAGELVDARPEPFGRLGLARAECLRFLPQLGEPGRGLGEVALPECPVDAIFSEDEVPAGQEQFLALNAELAKEWPVITQRKEPPADADAWKGVPDKLPLLER